MSDKSIHIKHYEQWTRKEFESLPELDRWDDVNGYWGDVDCFILIPTCHYHDSGYRIMDVVVIKGDKPIGRYADMTDSIQLKCDSNAPTSWNMDCLPVSGLIRFWSSNRNSKIVSPFSSFMIESADKDIIMGF